MELDLLVKALDPARGVTVEAPDIERIIAGAQPAQRRGSETRYRIGRSSRPAWAWLAVLTALAVVLVLGLGVLPSPKPRSGTVSRPGEATKMPSEMVVWTSTGRIDVISSLTGRVIRSLASDVGLYRGIPRMTVSASGAVYFDEAQRVNGVPTEQVMEVPLSGGRVTAVADGHDPALSPNGQLLAYLTYTDLSNTPEGIAVRNLVTGTTRKWAYSTNTTDINQLSWAPDSRSLSFTTTTPFHVGSLVLRAWALNVNGTSRSLGDARQIPLPTGVAWAGYLSETEGIGVIQHRGLVRGRDSFQLIEVDARTGRTIKPLKTAVGSLNVDNTYDGAESTVEVDPSRRELSIVEVGSGHGTLYRWTIGSVPVVFVATDVVTAAWVPAGSNVPGP